MIPVLTCAFVDASRSCGMSGCPQARALGRLRLGLSVLTRTAVLYRRPCVTTVPSSLRHCAAWRASRPAIHLQCTAAERPKVAAVTVEARVMLPLARLAQVHRSQPGALSRASNARAHHWPGPPHGDRTASRELPVARSTTPAVALRASGGGRSPTRSAAHAYKCV